MGKTVGILCASDTELSPFLPHLKREWSRERAMLTFYGGELCGRKAVMVYSGVCKVNAAVAAQLLIDAFGAEILLNAGTAGGMAEQVRLFDTVVSEEIAYHDVAGDILTEFHPWMKSVYFPADPALLAAARKCAASLDQPVLFGRTVTGEQFIAEENRAEINRRFSPLATDMESGAAAHVCYVNQIPFLAVRSISDTAQHSGVGTFEENCERASALSAQVVLRLLEQMNADGI